MCECNLISNKTSNKTSCTIKSIKLLILKLGGLIMQTLEILLWLDGTKSYKLSSEIFNLQKYDPELGYYFELDEHLFVFHNNMWMEHEQ